ncbi:hypothetical protein [uncultured Bartonella sp.]|nr:hypothetical protein [uncultured Bartonella sp.]
MGILAAGRPPTRLAKKLIFKIFKCYGLFLILIKAHEKNYFQVFL